MFGSEVAAEAISSRPAVSLRAQEREGQFRAWGSSLQMR